MFQYATARALALRYDVELLLDVSGFKNYDLRRYELDQFAIDARVATQEDLERAGVVPRPSSPVNLLLKRMKFYRPVNVLHEESFTYDARIESTAIPVYLDGYWQSERYFASIADILNKDFTLKDKFDAANADLMAQIAQTGNRAVSLHIRRGDYVSNPQTTQYHGVCSLDYYRAAVQHVAERVGEPHFFVFSDDHDWVRANFNIGHSTTLVQVNGPDRGGWDMALMKACHHHIVANSSFSWWGAWLNPSLDKIVVAPQRWFSGASHDTRDLVPSTWTRL